MLLNRKSNLPWSAFNATLLTQRLTACCTTFLRFQNALRCFPINESGISNCHRCTACWGRFTLIKMRFDEPRFNYELSRVSVFCGIMFLKKYGRKLLFIKVSNNCMVFHCYFQFQKPKTVGQYFDSIMNWKYIFHEILKYYAPQFS